MPPPRSADQKPSYSARIRRPTPDPSNTAPLPTDVSFINGDALLAKESDKVPLQPRRLKPLTNKPPLNHRSTSPRKPKVKKYAETAKKAPAPAPAQQRPKTPQVVLSDGRVLSPDVMSMNSISYIRPQFCYDVDVPPETELHPTSKKGKKRKIKEKKDTVNESLLTMEGTSENNISHDVNDSVL